MQEEDVRRYGTALEEILAAKGVTKQALEATLGWSKGTVSKICKGRYSLKIGNLLQILSAIGVDPLDFYARVHEGPNGAARQPLSGRILGHFGEPRGETEPLLLPQRLSAEELQGLIESAVRKVLAEGAAGKKPA